MNCDRQVLSLYRDGELAPEQKRQVDEHVSGCADCQATLLSYRAISHAIRSMPVPPPPLSLGADVRRRIAERELQRRRVGPFGGLLRAASPALAAAAVILGLLVIVRPGAGVLPGSTPAPAGEQIAAGGAPSAGSGTSSTAAPEFVGVRQGEQGPVVRVPDRQMGGGVPSIARLYGSNGALGERLGAPDEGSKTVTLVEQSFQGGLALRRSDTREIYVLQRAGGTWAVYPDTWRSGDPVASDGTPPPGAMAPGSGFGTVWSAHPEVRARLGWAVYESRGSGGAIQAFERGIIIWSPHGLLYVLADDGTWKTYPDATPL